MNKKYVGQEYTAFVKSKWTSWSLWWGRLLMSAGALDFALVVTGNGAVLTPYLGKHAPEILVAFGLINQLLRRRTTSAVK